MIEKFYKLKEKQHIGIWFVFTIVLLYICAFLASSPSQIYEGMLAILNTRAVLITDYFVIGGVGAALFNAATILLMSLACLWLVKSNFSGITIAAMFTMGGFALFGKNPLNILPIIFGCFIYAKVQGVSFNKYIYVAFFATTLSPIVSEMAIALPFSPLQNVLISILVGIFIGYIIVPLSMHTVAVHHGYALFNVGFAAGIVALILVSIFRSLGYEIETVLFWQYGIDYATLGLVCFYCLLLCGYGLVLMKFNIKLWFKLLKHPGRSVADFILLDGIGPTFFNMGAVGLLCTMYLVLVGGCLNGPTIGAIATVMGFAAFGVHCRNYLPILIGVMLATLLNSFPITEPSVQLSALFAAGISPIAGQFGIVAGLIAGFLHAAVSKYAGAMNCGMNLYNNGFASGFIALLMIPLLESFIKHFNEREKS